MTDQSALAQLTEDADLEPAEALHVLDADKAILGGNCFLLLSDGSLAGMPVKLDGSYDWSLLTTIDMPDEFEHPDLCRAARAMLDIAADRAPTVPTGRTFNVVWSALDGSALRTQTVFSDHFSPVLAYQPVDIRAVTALAVGETADLSDATVRLTVTRSA